jgi:hypothetical protein
MSARRSRHEIESAIKSTQPWATVLTDGMDADCKYLFDRRLRAIELYIEGDSIAAIKEATGIYGAEVYRLINRCLSVSNDGLVWGYQALIPNFRLGSYKRVSPLKPKLPESKSGYAGAFSHLLARYTELEPLLVRKILKLKHEKTVYEFRISPQHVHKAMLDFLKRNDHPKDEWPYNTKLLGSRSIGALVKKVLDQNFDRNVIVNSEAAAQAHLAVGSGKDAMLTYEYMMEAAEVDSYHIDADFIIGFENADGLITYVPIERINILALVDRASTAVWWFLVVFRSEVRATDVVRLLTESLRANLPRPEKEVLGMSFKGDIGFPTEVFPELAHTIPTVLMPDNALSNLAVAVSSILRKKLGYTLCFGPPGHFECRPNVERTFKELATKLFQRLPSTTGAGPGSGRAKDGVKIAAKLKMDASVIEELAYHHFALSNATPSEGICFNSPHEYIRQKIEQNGRHYIPRTLLQESISKMTHYRITELLTVRSYPDRGVRPFVQIDRVHYSSDLLREASWLTGQEITVEIDEQDMRFATAYWPNGAVMDVLKAAGKWSRTKHSRATRKAINSMISQKALIVSDFDDPVTLYLEKLKEIAQGKITNPVKAAKSPARAATEIKRVELEVAEGMELEVEDLEPSAETGSIFDPSEGLQESERKLDQSSPEATPNKTATIIPYPMPDLNKIIKGF